MTREAKVIFERASPFYFILSIFFFFYSHYFASASPPPFVIISTWRTRYHCLCASLNEFTKQKAKSCHVMSCHIILAKTRR